MFALECIEAGGPGKRKFERLREVIKHNLSYLLFARIKEFKAELSTSDQARLDIPEIDLDVTLARADFEALIADPLQRIADVVDATLERAGLTAEDIDIVLRTGGSSLIPAVKQLLDARFQNKVVEHDPFTSVATGLAIANYYGWQFEH